MNKQRLLIAALAVLLPSLAASTLSAQGITTGTISARVLDAAGNPRAGVRVIAVHQPSGTVYQARTRDNGRATLPGMRVGGPYTITASSIGLASKSEPNVWVTLGQTSDLQFTMQESAVQIQEVTVTAALGADKIMNSSRTGAATTVSREALATLPTVSGKLESIVRLTPQFGGCNVGTGCTMAGQDGRMNNISVDGTAFNNSFGLGGQPGDRTNVAPISLSAIEQMQVEVAPYDVRQGNFVGANINTVTRSGTNRLAGSIGYSRRDQSLVGKKAGDFAFDPGVFSYKNLSGWLSGPIIPNKLFFFVTADNESLSQPGTTWLANTGGQPVTGNTTRVLASDLNTLSTFLATNFNYDTGPYQGYNNLTPAHRFLGKLDFNINDNNKFVLRYNRLISSADILESNSNSLGTQGNRRTNANSLNFSNSNYGMMENIESTVGELNSTFGNGMANSLSIGYTRQNESRKPKGQFFPLVDIQEGAFTYTSFGFEPFTPNNLLYYNTFQIQDNFTKYTTNHDFTFGVSVEKYHSDNTFFPGSQSVYVYRSLADFYTDANGYLANPARTTTPVNLLRFQVRYANIPGQDKPVQPLDVLYSGVYGQDEWRMTQNFKVNLGVRFDVPKFKNTAFDNANADALFWRDETGATVQYNTGKLPDTRVTISPRLGINWDKNGDRSTQIRGGTGIFSGRPAYVWISNQIGNTGVLTGFDQLDPPTGGALNTRPFNPDPNHYKPQTPPTGAPATSYELALTDPNFRFPKLWRTDIGFDKKLPWGIIGTADFMYNRDLDGIYYINANLPAAQSAFVGADSRLRWVGVSCAAPTTGPCVNRINNATGNIVARNIVMKNQSIGRAWNIDGSVERPFANGLFLKAAYNYGVAKNTIDPGSIASGSWNGNPMSGDPNNPGLSYSSNSPGHRFFIATSYRKEYFSFGATTLSLFFDAHTNGNTSYTFANDMNGDGVTNDLIYIPRNVSEMNFTLQNCSAAVCGVAKVFTPADQATAWEAFIQQDDYLKSHRGQYAQRNAVFLPLVKRADFSIQQELFTDFARRRNSFQIRADVVNVGNLLNKHWGVGQRILGGNGQILTNGGADALGRATYQLKVVNGELINRTFEPTAGRADVFEVQLGFRYTFN